ncbi:MAG: hypothetical protein ABFD54_18225 [Armatimonadota bacterium]|nr:hypothetical protein [bacterium]
MANKGTCICVIMVILALIAAKAVFPVWMGTGLVMVGFVVGKEDLSSPSASRRRAGFKRMASVMLTGMLLIITGLQADKAPWSLQIADAEQARHALLSLWVYSAALIGSPVLAWAYMMHRERPAKRQVRRVRRERTLSRLADQTNRRHLRAAV